MWQDHFSTWHTIITRAPPGARVATPTPDGRTTPGRPTGRDISFETGLTLEEATGKVEAEIPVAPVLTPF